MGWGLRTSGGSQSAINDTVEEFSNWVTLKPGELAHCQVRVNNESGSVTNGIITKLYTTLSETAEISDDLASQEFEYVPGGINDEYFPMIVSGVYKFRLGWLAAAATDDYTAELFYRLDGVDAS